MTKNLFAWAIFKISGCVKFEFGAGRLLCQPVSACCAEMPQSRFSGAGARLCNEFSGGSLRGRERAAEDGVSGRASPKR